MTTSERVHLALESGGLGSYEPRVQTDALAMVVWLLEGSSSAVPGPAEAETLIRRVAETPSNLLSLWREIERGLQSATGDRDLRLPAPTGCFSAAAAVSVLQSAVARHEADATQDEHVVVRQAKGFVEHHYHEQHTMQDVADRLDVSYAYFSTLFKQQTGETYTHYLTRVRMEKARHLLEEVRMPVGDVAARVGYLYPRHFSRAFKKFWGMTPQEFVSGQRRSP